MARRCLSALVLLGLLLLSSSPCRAQDYPENDMSVPANTGVPPNEGFDPYEDPNAPGEGAIPPDAGTENPFDPPGDDQYIPGDDQPVPAQMPSDIPAEPPAAGDAFPPGDDQYIPPEDAGALPPTDAPVDAAASPPASAEAALVDADDTVSAGTSGGKYSAADFEASYESLKSGKISAEGIIGIVVGVSLGTLVVLMCACVCWIRQRNIHRSKYGNEQQMPGDLEM